MSEIPHYSVLADQIYSVMQDLVNGPDRYWHELGLNRPAMENIIHTLHDQFYDFIPIYLPKHGKIFEQGAFDAKEILATDFHAPYERMLFMYRDNVHDISEDKYYDVVSAHFVISEGEESPTRKLYIITFNYDVAHHIWFSVDSVFQTYMSFENDAIAVEVSDPKYYREAMTKEQDDFFIQGLQLISWIVYQAIIFMNYPPEGTLKEQVPSALKQQRRKNKKKPLLPTSYTIDLRSLAGKAVHSDGTIGKHKSPRVHWRRGHWRHYENYKRWIKPMIVGSGDKVSHSYRIKK